MNKGLMGLYCHEITKLCWKKFKVTFIYQGTIRQYMKLMDSHYPISDWNHWVSLVYVLVVSNKTSRHVNAKNTIYQSIFITFSKIYALDIPTIAQWHVSLIWGAFLVLNMTYVRPWTAQCSMQYCTRWNCVIYRRIVCSFQSDRNTYLRSKLTYWGRVTHICVNKLTIIGSDNGLSPDRRQAIIWTNAGMSLIRTSGTNFSEIHTFSFKKMHLKMSSGKWRSFCLGLNELTSVLA